MALVIVHEDPHRRGEVSDDECDLVLKSLGRICLVTSFAAMVLAAVLDAMDARGYWLGATLGTSAGFALAFVFLGWADFKDSVTRFRKRIFRRRSRTWRE